MRWTLQEMIARVAKNELRAQQRAVRHPYDSRVFAEDQLKKHMVAYFNVLLGYVYFYVRVRIV